MDDPLRFIGHDKRAPPSRHERHARPNVRRTTFDDPFPWRDPLVASTG